MANAFAISRVTNVLSITGLKGQDLTLGTGTFGTALTFTSATGAATFAATITGSVAAVLTGSSANNRFVVANDTTGATRALQVTNTAQSSEYFGIASSSTASKITSLGGFSIGTGGSGTTALSIDTSQVSTFSGSILGSGGSAPTSTTTGSNVFTAGIATSGPGFFGARLNITGSTGGTALYTNMSTGAANASGVVFQDTFTNAAAGSINGLQVQPTLSGTGQNVFTGVNVQMIANSITVGTVRGVHILNPQTTSSTVTLLQGLAIDNISGAATNYAIQTGTGLVNFGDTTSGTSTTSASVIAKSLALSENLVTGGGQGWGITSTATAGGTTVLTATSKVIQIFTGSAAQAVTLPAANVYGSTAGAIYVLKNRSTGAVTINRAGSDTIDGGTSYVLAAGANDAVMLVSDGVSSWSVT